MDENNLYDNYDDDDEEDDEIDIYILFDYADTVGFFNKSILERRNRLFR